MLQVGSSNAAVFLRHIVFQRQPPLMSCAAFFEFLDGCHVAFHHVLPYNAGQNPRRSIFRVCSARVSDSDWVLYPASVRGPERWPAALAAIAGDRFESPGPGFSPQDFCFLLCQLSKGYLGHVDVGSFLNKAHRFARQGRIRRARASSH